VVARYECVRCHETAWAAAPADRDCRGCHTDIQAGAYDTWRYDAEHVARWKQTIRHYVDVPSLHAADRFERDWLVSFLQAPHDLRPGLEEAMPRMPIDREAAFALADALGARDRDGVVSGDAGRGRALFGEKGCGTCHAFSGVDVPAASPPPVAVEPRAVKLAPDLRWARNRLDPETMERWLADPKAVKADAAMPRVPLSPEERADLVAFVATSPLGPEPEGAVPARLPPLERQVAWEEVWDRVFGKTCRHCHSDGAAGDSGPGNEGGFGFAGKGLDLSSEASAAQHVQASGGDELVARLWARYAEGAGQPTDRVGMPLGLPPLGPTDIQLLESWVRQQANGPDRSGP
jgi:mono/diheme cytochrome c family protein